MKVRQFTTKVQCSVLSALALMGVWPSGAAVAQEDHSHNAAQQ